MIIIITSYVSVYILIAIMFLFFFGIHAMHGLYTEPHVFVARHYYSEILSAVYLVSFNYFCDFGGGLLV